MGKVGKLNFWSLERRKQSGEDEEERQRVKTKQSILTQLPPPWPSQQRAAPPHWLPPLPTKEEKLDLPLSTEQLRRLFLPFRPLSLSLGWTDGLRLFTAGSSRHSSSRPTAPHRRLCAVSSAASLLLYTHPPRRGKTSRSDSLLLQLPGLCFAFSVFQSLDLAFTFLAHQTPYTQLM